MEPVKNKLKIEFGAYAQDEAILRLWNLVLRGKHDNLTAWQAFSTLYDAPKQAHVNSVMFGLLAVDAETEEKNNELADLSKTCTKYCQKLVKAGRGLLEKVADELIAYADKITEKK